MFAFGETKRIALSRSFRLRRRAASSADRSKKALTSSSVLKKETFEIKIDERFSEVIQACAKRKDTWINQEIIESYEKLHELGYVHSVEAWQEGKLADKPVTTFVSSAEQHGGQEATILSLNNVFYHWAR